jgi:enoyl-CoA hydratase/carnithine racemase
MAIQTRDFQCTLYAVHDHVLTITLNRPERRNALNPRAYSEIEAAFRAANDDENVRVVIVTGADPSFCSGEDVKEMMTGDARPASPSVAATGRPPTPAAMAVLDCEKPVIAAVNGTAVGWGMELALYADIRLASEQIAEPSSSADSFPTSVGSTGCRSSSAPPRPRSFF